MRHALPVEREAAEAAKGIAEAIAVAITEAIAVADTDAITARETELRERWRAERCWEGGRVCQQCQGELGVWG